MKRKRVLFAVLVIICFALFTALMIRSTENIGLSVSAVPERKAQKVLIDPGHGGEDGGAVTGDVLEKNINLSISRDTSDLLTFLGFDVFMTRTTDNALTSEGEDVKKRKYNDMKMRLDMYNSPENDLVVSIHQNKFSVASSKGTQVFYSPNNEKSAYLAECIRFSVKEMLQPGNERECKAAGKEIYLLKNTEKPAVIVECGFISNREELKKLLDEEYQKQMSLAVATGIINYCNTN